jgi:pilus assembly protein Flp/PilA
MSMKKILAAFLADEDGLTMVEYAVAGCLVITTAVTAFSNLGAAVVTRISALVSVVNS